MAETLRAQTTMISEEESIDLINVARGGRLSLVQINFAGGGSR